MKKAATQNKEKIVYTKRLTDPRPPYQPCGIFRVEASVLNPRTSRTQTIASSHLAGDAIEEDGYFVCNYAFTDTSALPHNRAFALAAYFDQSASGLESSQWVGGTDTTPPAGKVRTLIVIGGNGSVVLTSSQPRANVYFEMVYSY